MVVLEEKAKVVNAASLVHLCVFGMHELVACQAP